MVCLMSGDCGAMRAEPPSHDLIVCRMLNVPAVGADSSRLALINVGYRVDKSFLSVNMFCLDNAQ